MALFNGEVGLQVSWAGVFLAVFRIEWQVR